MSYLGFDAISTLAEDTRDPTGRTLGRAIIYVLVLATVLFVLTTWILGNLMIGTPITDPAGAAYELLGKTVGAWAAIALAWAVTIVAGFTNAVPMQVGVAKVLFAMGRDRQLFSCFARVHPKYQTPWIAMLVATAISVVAAVFMRNLVDELASTVNFGALLGFLMLHISVLVHFGVRKRSRRWIQHWVIPLAGIGVVLAVLWGMGTLAITIGMSWLLGGILYTLFLRSRRIGAVVGA
jgi:amino acid transporter